VIAQTLPVFDIKFAFTFFLLHLIAVYLKVFTIGADIIFWLLQHISDLTELVSYYDVGPEFHDKDKRVHLEYGVLCTHSYGNGLVNELSTMKNSLSHMKQTSAQNANHIVLNVNDYQGLFLLSMPNCLKKKNFQS